MWFIKMIPIWWRGKSNIFTIKINFHILSYKQQGITLKMNCSNIHVDISARWKGVKLSDPLGKNNNLKINHVTTLKHYKLWYHPITHYKDKILTNSSMKILACLCTFISISEYNNSISVKFNQVAVAWQRSPWDVL